MIRRLVLSRAPRNFKKIPIYLLGGKIRGISRSRLKTEGQRIQINLIRESSHEIDQFGGSGSIYDPLKEASSLSILGSGVFFENNEIETVGGFGRPCEGYERHLQRILI